MTASTNLRGQDVGRLAGPRLEDMPYRKVKKGRKRGVSSAVKKQQGKRIKQGVQAAGKTRRQIRAEEPVLVEQAKQASGAWGPDGKPVVPAKRKTSLCPHCGRGICVGCPLA